MERKPAGIVAVQENTVVVVCDDGSVWSGELGETQWKELPPIPGTPRQRIIDHDKYKQQLAADEAQLRKWEVR
jgi:hypothetical protein